MTGTARFIWCKIASIDVEREGKSRRTEPVSRRVIDVFPIDIQFADAITPRVLCGRRAKNVLPLSHQYGSPY